MKKLTALALILTALICCLGTSAEEDEGLYVLMTIPYELFL